MSLAVPGCDGGHDWHQDTQDLCTGPFYHRTDNNRGWVPGKEKPTAVVHRPPGSLCIQFSAPTVDSSTDAGESMVRRLLLLSEERDTTLPFCLAAVLLPVININLRKSTGHVTMREVHRLSGDVWPKDICSCCFTAILGSDRAGNGYH